MYPLLTIYVWTWTKNFVKNRNDADGHRKSPATSFTGSEERKFSPSYGAEIVFNEAKELSIR
jgi:hypothetical protein